MADRISASFSTAAFTQSMRRVERTIGGAVMFGLRKTAREVQKAERQATTKKSGRLQASIKPGRIIRSGDTFVIRVAHRDPVAYKYAAKIDARDHHVDAGRAAGESVMHTVMEQAVGRVLR